MMEGISYTNLLYRLRTEADFDVTSRIADNNATLWEVKTPNRTYATFDGAADAIVLAIKLMLAEIDVLSKEINRREEEAKNGETDETP